MRAALVLIALGLAWLGFASASARADCEHFKWSVAKEREALAAPAPLPASGGEGEAGKGYKLALQKNLALPTPPERAPKPDSFAGVVVLPQLAAGRYQIALSQEAWIDVVENGKSVKSSDFSGQKDCPGLRKSVRFDLGAGPATVEISNAGVDTINLVVAPTP